MQISSGSFDQRYELQGVLGEGGMGVVYRAWDDVLQRTVAIKLIHRSGSSAERRFLREARAQARLNHDNICQVFDVGEDRGRLYVAMELINGSNLARAKDSLTLPEKVEVIAEVADAVHAAHLQGLVHRDIKPSNIMVERLDEGRWKPWIVDFGLVHDLDDQSATASSGIIGSPYYMAPEQVQGKSEQIDWRTDVYGIGATLFELLNGDRPYGAVSSGEALIKVLEEDVAFSPRARTLVPGDLRAITLRCLEKDPNRRYASAHELAQDLRRFQTDQPVLARPIGAGARALRLLRRHRTVSTVIAIAVVALLVLAGLWAHSVAQARHRSLVERVFTAEVSGVEEISRYASLAPLHDITAEHERVRTRMHHIQAQIERYGEDSVGPGSYALGQCHLTLGESRAAVDSLQRAWQAGYRGSRVAYALGRALGEVYEDRLDEASMLHGAALQARLQELQQQYRDPALAYLKLARSNQLEHPALIEGFIALYEQRYDSALASARTAAAAASWLYEAAGLEGAVHLARSRSLAESGDAEGALQALDEAGDAYARALEIGRSDPGVLTSECRRWLEAFTIRVRNGLPVEGVYDSTIAVIAQARRAVPHSTQVALIAAELSWVAAEYELRHGGDPVPYLTTCIDTATGVLDQDPTASHAHALIGTASWRQAYYEDEHGLDIRPTARRALEALEHAIRIDPQYAWAYNVMGNLLWLLASWESAHGLDPRAALDRGIAASEQAVALLAQASSSQSTLGVLYMLRAEDARSKGQDAQTDLDRAIACGQKAVTANPQSSSALNNLGMAYQALAGDRERQGLDPAQALQQAIDTYERSVSVNPNNYYPCYNAANLYLKMAELQLSNDGDPEAELAKAFDRLEQSDAINPDSASTAALQAQGHTLRARFLLARGCDPTQALDRAAACLAKSLRIAPELPNALRNRVAVAFERARWLQGQGRPVHEQVHAGLEAAEHLLRIKPGDLDGYLLSGRLQLLLAGSSTGERRSTAAAQALRDLQQAAALNPGVAEQRQLADDMSRCQAMVDEAR